MYISQTNRLDSLKKKLGQYKDKEQKTKTKNK